MASTEGRYRRIHVRIHSSRKFRAMDPLRKNVWVTLLTHELMTPMGAGTISLGILDEAIGRVDGVCWKCGLICQEHSPRVMLEEFREAGLIYWDGMLVIIVNYLVHNIPQNPNALASWIGSCVELPQSEMFGPLLDHLREVLDGRPAFLFAGLLEPLAAQENRTLLSNFWARVGGKPVVKGSVSANRSRRVPAKAPRTATRNDPEIDPVMVHRNTVAVAVTEKSNTAPADASAVADMQQEWVEVDQAVQRVKSIWRPAVRLLAAETGIQALSGYDLGFVSHLDQRHSPGRVEQEILRHVELFKQRGRPLEELTFEYLWQALQYQRSLPLKVSDRLTREGIGRVAASPEKISLYEQAGRMQQEEGSGSPGTVP